MSEKKETIVSLYKQDGNKEQCISVTLDRFTPNIRVKLKEIFEKLPNKPAIMDEFIDIMAKQEEKNKEKLKPLVALCKDYSENKISEEDFNKKYKYEELKVEMENSNSEMFNMFKEDKFSFDMLMALKSAPKDSNGMPIIDFNLLWNEQEQDKILNVKLEAFKAIIKHNEVYEKNKDLLDEDINSDFWQNQDIEKMIEAVEFFRSKIK